MIRLGLRLSLNGGKEAAVRLVLTAAAVAVGVGLLLITLAGMNALNAQNARDAWLNTGQVLNAGPGTAPGLQGPGSPPGTPGPQIGPTTSTGDPLWWMYSTDHFGSKTIDRVDVAATGPDSPVPPGLAHLPGPGQYYASPALGRLLRSTPADELADRYPGRQVGTIGARALPSPNSLIVVVGHTPAQLSQQPRASEVVRINTDSRVDGSNGWDANKLQTVLAVGVLALLFPVLVFIGTATRLAAARREQRFAAMRLVGATPRQVSVIAAVEASVAAWAGVAVGFGVFFLLLPVLTNYPFTGEPFASGDLSLSGTDILAVVVGVPVAAAAAARIAMRRVRISPLGVTRRVTPKAPRSYRLIPLLAGVAELTYFVVVGHPRSTGGQILAYFSGCLLMMAGLVIAGPWLTMVGARVLAGRTKRPAALIAGRRLSDNPRSAFRAISGLIIALFVTSVSVGVISTILDDQGSPGGSTDANATVVGQFGAGPGSTSVPSTLVEQLGAIPGVKGVTVLYANPQDHAGPPGNPAMLASCDQLARTPVLGRCEPGAEVAAFHGSLDTVGPITGNSSLASRRWPSASIPLTALQRLPVRGVVVSTDGSRPAIERARTTLEVAWPDQDPASTLGEINEANTRLTLELQQMTDVVILASLVIAGCSLAVSVTAGVNDRKRPFSLLRLAGVPLKALRRMVALEAAVPLLVVSVLSAGMGFLAAGLFLNSQLGLSLRPPGLDYYVLVIAGLAASLGLIAATFPLIERITGPEVARNE